VFSPPGVCNTYVDLQTLKLWERDGALCAVMDGDGGNSTRGGGPEGSSVFRPARSGNPRPFTVGWLPTCLGGKRDREEENTFWVWPLTRTAIETKGKKKKKKWGGVCRTQQKAGVDLVRREEGNCTRGQSSFTSEFR